MAVPITTVLKYQVRWRMSKYRCAVSPMTKSITPRSPTAREGVYLARWSVIESIFVIPAHTNPYIMIEASFGPIGLGKLGST